MASSNKSANPFAAFTIASVERSASAGEVDPTTRVRNRFIEAVDHQLALVADPKATKTVRQHKDGKRQDVEVAIKPWWFELDGATYTVVKYGSKNVALDGDKKHIQVAKGSATKKQLSDTFNKLVKLATDGELDEVLKPYATRPGKKSN